MTNEDKFGIFLVAVLAGCCLIGAAVLWGA